MALGEVLYNNNFDEEINGFAEKAYANGTGVIVEYIADEKVMINYLYGDRVMVLDYHNTTINSIGIIQEFVKDEKTYTHVQYHLFDGTTYRIEHEIYQKGKKGYLSSKASLDVLFTDEEIEGMRQVEVDENGNEEVKYYLEYETQTPHFQIFKPAVVNNFDSEHPMGISIFANAITPAEGVDDAYYTLRTEDENTRKHVYVSDEGTKTQKTKQTTASGTKIKYVKYFNRDDTLHRSMKMPENKPIEAYGPEHNGLTIKESINEHLNLFGFS